MKNLKCVFLPALIVIAIMLTECKTAPKPVPPPPVVLFASLQFGSIEAHDISTITLNYTLNIKNPNSQIIEVLFDKWNVIINDEKTAVEPAFPEFRFAEISPGKNAFNAAAGTENIPGIIEIPVKLDLDIPSLIAAGVPIKDDFKVELVLDFLYKSGPETMAVLRPAETFSFPYIREPVFSITSIAILQAELINTRFRVGIRIENPNHFPVELASFEYDLYGNGLLWADGRERNVINVPAKTSIQGNLFLLMNFINMKRDLLDQIIKLEDVNYGFNGEAMVGTGVDYLPVFKTIFNLSGYSKVFEN